MGARAAEGRIDRGPRQASRLSRARRARTRLYDSASTFRLRVSCGESRPRRSTCARLTCTRPKSRGSLSRFSSLLHILAVMSGPVGNLRTAPGSSAPRASKSWAKSLPFLVALLAGLYGAFTALDSIRVRYLGSASSSQRRKELRSERAGAMVHLRRRRDAGHVSASDISLTKRYKSDSRFYRWRIEAETSRFRDQRR